jgi:hypothetical protein
LRDYVNGVTGLDVESLDPVKIAEYTMSKAIAEGLGLGVDAWMKIAVSDNKPVGTIVVKDLLFPFISFKTKRFQDVLEVYKGLAFDPAVEQAKKPDDRWGHPCAFGKMWLVFGLGGLHHNYGMKTGKKKFKARGLVHRQVPGSQLLMPDVSSYYPSMRIKHIPHKYDPHFMKEYEKAYKEKAQAKKEKNKEMEAYAKLRLNSIYGLYNSLYSPVYQPAVSYGTAINGQLMLAMLIESLDVAGIEVLGTNTDSVTVRVKDEQLEEYHKICTWWEGVTSMGLDHDEFTAIYEQSCNNYIATMPGGYIKCKGTMVRELDMLKGYKYPIVKEALIQYFTAGVPVEQTIRECTDIYEFCMTSRMGTSKKTGEKFEAYHKGIKLQRTNRYYAGIGPDSGYLYKSSKGGEDVHTWKKDPATEDEEGKYDLIPDYDHMASSMEHVLKDTGVIILNQFLESTNYNINYKFYEREANKVIREIEPEQLSLF